MLQPSDPSDASAKPPGPTRRARARGGADRASSATELAERSLLPGGSLRSDDDDGGDSGSGSSGVVGAAAVADAPGGDVVVVGGGDEAEQILLASARPSSSSARGGGAGGALRAAAVASPAGSGALSRRAGNHGSTAGQLRTMALNGSPRRSQFWEMVWQPAAVTGTCACVRVRHWHGQFWEMVWKLLRTFTPTLRLKVLQKDLPPGATCPQRDKVAVMDHRHRRSFVRMRRDVVAFHGYDATSRQHADMLQMRRRNAGRQAGKQAGRQAGRKEGSWLKGTHERTHVCSCVKLRAMPCARACVHHRQPTAPQYATLFTPPLHSLMAFYGYYMDIIWRMAFCGQGPVRLPPPLPSQCTQQ
eukprot:356299-Chlamydomonas_euryale.AAC.1